MTSRGHRPTPLSPRRAAAVLLALFSLACAPAQDGGGEGPLVAFEEDRFGLVVQEVAAEGSRALHTRLTQRGEWHFSLDYPIRMELEAEGLALQRTWRKAEAVEVAEGAVAFQVPFEVAKEGGGRVAGTLHFGVCRSDELCEPVSETFETRLR